MANWQEALGFTEPIDVSGRFTVADHFPQSKRRCGIYLLEFDDGLYYIGKSVNVVRRFAEHQRAHGTIVRLRFQAAARRELDAIERALIRRAESLDVRLTNIVHAAVIQGATDFDLLLTEEEQHQWLDDPDQLDRYGRDKLRVAVDSVQRLRYRRRFEKLKAIQHYQPLLGLLQLYVDRTIPAPGRTEHAYWSISCLPSTGMGDYRRLICVNINKMETFVIGQHKRELEEVAGFINIAASTAHVGWRWRRKMGERVLKWMGLGPHYESAGYDLARDTFYSIADGERLLTQPHVQQAARTLNLRLMRKGTNLQRNSHCFDLADAALGRMV